MVDDQYALAATFATRDQAHEAIKELKNSGFRKTWIGVVKHDDFDQSYAATSTEPHIEPENWFERVFNGSDESLHAVLTRHRVVDIDMQAVSRVAHFEALVTVDGENHPEEAAQILARYSGRVINKGFGATGFGTNGAHALFDQQAAAAEARSRDYGQYRGGETLDAQKRLQLREERLRVVTESERSGEMQIGKHIVEQDNTMSVPVSHEELFIERRPVSGTATGTVRDIDASDETEILRVPLSREKVRLEKDTVATEEVVIGKRQVTEQQSVSATTRKEVLDVDDEDAEDMDDRVAATPLGRSESAL